MISIPTVMEATNDYDRRPVDVPLDSLEEDYEYRAQDFWVYIGRSLGVGLTMLEPLYENYGVTTQAVIDWAGSEANLQANYWNWVQNQVMLEDNILLNDDDDGNPCTFQGHVNNLYWHYIDHGSVVAEEPGTIAAFTTHVIEVELVDTLRPVDITVVDPTTGEENPDLYYKIYVDGELDCVFVDNGSREFTEEEWDEVITNGSRVFVIVAAIVPSQNERYEIVVETAPY